MSVTDRADSVWPAPYGYPGAAPVTATANTTTPCLSTPTREQLSAAILADNAELWARLAKL